tara:strand:- start:246 stop:608 length:363 start_codon:yes stop_codon:yes gene_type:complete
MKYLTITLLAMLLIYGCTDEKALGVYTCECTDELLCNNGSLTVKLLEGDYMEINSSKFKYSSSYSSVWSTENEKPNTFFNFYLYPWELKAKYENEYGSSELRCKVSFPNGEEYLSEEVSK